VVPRNGNNSVIFQGREHATITKKLIVTRRMAGHGPVLLAFAADVLSNRL